MLSMQEFFDIQTGGYSDKRENYRVQEILHSDGRTTYRLQEKEKRWLFFGPMVWADCCSPDPYGCGSNVIERKTLSQAKDLIDTWTHTAQRGKTY